MLGEKKKHLPGHGYCSKLLTFIDSHFYVGELYVEYQKSNCLLEGQLEIELYPRPVPGGNGKFLPLNETPNVNRHILLDFIVVYVYYYYCKTCFFRAHIKFALFTSTEISRKYHSHR